MLRVTGDEAQRWEQLRKLAIAVEPRGKCCFRPLGSRYQTLGDRHKYMDTWRF